MLNCISRSLRSPSNLRRWGVKSEGQCFLCNRDNATAAHILSNCSVALQQNRYTCRHDNVLIIIHKDLVGLVKKKRSTDVTLPEVHLWSHTSNFTKKANANFPVRTTSDQFWMPIMHPTGKLTLPFLVILQSLARPS